MEYIIEQTKKREYKIDSNNTNYSIVMDLNNPVKYLIWTVQLKSNLDKYNLSTKYNLFDVSQYDSTTSNSFSLYPTINNYELSPIDVCNIQISNQNITADNTSYKFYNYVVPYQFFDRTPADGINIIAYH